MLDRGYTLSEAYELWRRRAAGECDECEREREAARAEHNDSADRG